MSRNPCASHDWKACRSGFTLVEILIVVVILGILGAMVVPRFVSASSETRTSALKMNLNRIRSQLLYYQIQHGVFPDLANFTDQMTQASDSAGNTALPGTDGFPFGPYLLEIPINPMTGSATLGDGAVGSSDWFYDQTTGDFRANDSAENFSY